MNEVMKMSRKALILAVTVSTLAWGVLATAMFAPLTTHAAGCTSGTLIKGSLAAVYYCGADGKRYVFPNKKTYDTWYSDFSGVTTISDADLASIQIGGNVTYRPGVKMVKIQTDPKTYAVAKNGTLRHVASEAVATDLYGANWNQQIDDVPDAFFTNYSVGAAINSAGEYDKNAQMSSSQTINQDKGLSSGGDVSGTLTVSKASDSPAGATVPLGATGVNMLKFHVTNNGSSAMTVDNVTVRRVGPGSTSDISAVYLYEGNTRLTTGRSVNSSTNEANFTGLGVSLNAGQTRTLWLAVDVSTSGTAGNVHAFKLQSAKSGTTELNGAGFMGSNFTLAGATVGTLTIAKTGSITNPKVGQKDAKIAEFTIEAGSSEDVMLNRLTLFQGGNLSAANLTNVELRQAGLVLATSSGFDAKLRATFSLSAGFLIEKGQTKTFQVYADIGGSARSADSLKIYVEEDADLHGVGQTFGYGASVTRTNYNGDSCTSSSGECSYSTVDAGQLTVNFLGPAAKDIPTNGENIEVFRFTMTAQSNIEVRNLRIKLTASDVNPTAGLVNTFVNPDVANYTDVKVFDADTGSVFAGPKDIDTTGNDTTQTLVFTDTFTLAAGETKTMYVTIDIADESGLNDDTITATLAAFQSSDLRNLDNSTFLTPSSDVVPTGDLEGNDFTVNTPSLALTLATSPVSQTYIKGSQDASFVGINFKAGDAAPVTMTSVKFTGYIDDSNVETDFVKGQDTDASGGTTAVSDDVLSCKLLDGTTQIGDTESPASGTDGTMTFDGFNLTVAAGATKTLRVTCDISNSAYRNSNVERISFDIADASADVTAQDPDGNSVTPTGDAANGGTSPTTIVTIENAGTLTFQLAPDDAESEAGIVVGGRSGVVLAKYRFTAQNEALKVTKSRLKLAVGSATGVETLSLYDGATLIGGPVAPNASGNADFSGMNFVVPKDGSKTMTVKAKLASVGPGGGTSGVDVKVTYEADDAFEARGVSSSTIITDAGTDTAARTKILRKTKPTVSLAALPTTTLTAGSMVLTRVTITADAAENVSLKSLTWDAARSAALGIASPVVREVGNPNITITSALDAAGDTDCDVAESDTCTIAVAFSDEQTVAAGTSKTYELVATISGVNSNDAITTTLSASGTSAVTGELDTSVGTNVVNGGSIQDFDGNPANGYYTFVWSDNSAIPHNDTVGTTSGNESASDDWTNGYLVKVLPTDAHTVIAP